MATHSFFKLLGRVFSNRSRSVVRRERTKRMRRSLFGEQLENRSLLAASLVNYQTNEHIQLNIGYAADDWSINVRNRNTDVQRANDVDVLYVGNNALKTRPAGSKYDFIGANAGESFYHLPHQINSNPDKLMLGFAALGMNPGFLDQYDPTAESKGRVTGQDFWVKATLAAVNHFTPDGAVGSGAFSVANLNLDGNGNVFMSSYNDEVSNPNVNGLDVTDGISADDAIWLPANGNSQFDVYFSERGRYEVDLKVSAYFGENGDNSTPNTGDFRESGNIRLYFSVESVGDLEFGELNYSVNEPLGPATITVNRVGGSDGRITVNYATSQGTASPGSDYSETGGVLTFLDGETQKTFPISIFNDGDQPEANETVHLTLSAPTPANIDGYYKSFDGDTNGLLGPISAATLSIIDNLPPTGVDDLFEVNPNGKIRGNVLANDFDIDGVVLTATVLSNPTLGTLDLSSDGTFTYMPGVGFAGTDSFTYEVSDSLKTSSATVTINQLPSGEFIAGFTKGHADIGVNYTGGSLQQIFNGPNSLTYAPSEILVQVGPTAETTVPTNPNFSFLGAVGETIYMLPDGATPTLPVLGFSTANIPTGVFEGDRLTLRLKSLNAPQGVSGHFSLYTVSAGVPTPYIATSDGLTEDDFLSFSAGVSHLHTRMAFGGSGKYALTFEVVGNLAAGGVPVSSGEFTYYVNVNQGAAPYFTHSDRGRPYNEQHQFLPITYGGIADWDLPLDFDGGQLRVDIPVGAHPDDELTVISATNAVHRFISVVGNDVIYNPRQGVPRQIATFTGGAGGQPLVISLNSNTHRDLPDQADPMDELLQQVAYRNLSDDPPAEARRIRFVVSDGDGAISDAQIYTVSIIPVNDETVFTTSSGDSSYTEQDAPIAIDAGITISDVDTHEFGGGFLFIGLPGWPNGQSGDRLTVIAQGNGVGEINLEGANVLYQGLTIGTYSGGFTTSSNLMILLNSQATPEAVQQLARSVAFHHVGDNPNGLARDIGFRLNPGDGSWGGFAGKKILVTAINDAPVISSIVGSINYVEDGTLLIANGAIVKDPDSSNLGGGILTVTLIEGAIPADVLAVRSQGPGSGKINVAGANVTYEVGGVPVVIGVLSGGDGANPLTVTLNGDATLAAVQALVRNVTFKIMESTASSSRVVRFSLTDGDGGTSADVDRSINVIPVNDRPVVTTSAGSTNYATLAPPAIIDSAIAIDDVDSPDFAGGKLVIRIITNQQSGDRLSILAQGNGAGEINLDGANVLYQGVNIGSYVGGFGPITINFNENANLAAVRALARRIAFSNTKATPSTLTRTISFLANDGDGGLSSPATKDVTVI